ncbi:MAG: hypothetical protein ABIS51_19870 [Sphingomonas sp.]
MQQIGGAGEELGKALGKIPAKKKELEKTPGETAAGQVPAANKQSEANQKPLNKGGASQNAVKPLVERAPNQTPKQAADDAAVKRAYNDYAEVTRSHLYSGNGAMAEQQGGDALAAAQPRAEQVLKARDDAAASLSPDLHEAFHAAIAPRVKQDLHFVQSQAAAAALVAQQQQSQRVVNNSAEDAVLQYGSPAFAESMATGLRQIDEQATTGGWTPEAKRIAETGFISRVHRGVSDAQSMSDPVLAADHLRVFGAHMTPEDRAAAWQSLQGPLIQTQAVADLDTLAIARSATAPLTPHGDHDGLVRRMLAITPAAAGAGANAPTDLPDMLDRYGGDVAKAWAASEMGADALDALVQKRGAGWFSALPAETRTAVAANMAMLEAVSSPRSAPTPEERARLAGEIEEQPWSNERKQNAYDELNTRIALGAWRDKEAQDAAKESGFALADQLGAGFISINQLPPAVRDKLAPDALAALTLRADRNVHPATVAPHGDVAMALNRQASDDPEEFAKQDLRLVQDQMTPREYASLERMQKGLASYPPAPAAVTQQRAWGKLRRSGLDPDQSNGAASKPGADADWNPPGDFSDFGTPTKPQNAVYQNSGQSQALFRPISESEDRITFGKNGMPIVGTGGKSLMESMLEPLFHAPEPVKPPPIFPGHPVRLPNGHHIRDDHSDSQLLMSPRDDLNDVAAAGREAGKSYRAIRDNPRTSGSQEFSIIADMARNVGQGGKFDYQREGNFATGFKQYRQFRNVSNFNVGLFMQQTGLYTLEQTLDISGKFASLFSSNYRKDQPHGLDPQTERWIRIGYNTGASGVYGKAKTK